ncbi:hypothetical protein F4553_000828 [Allocatelliglobosispora scoriae]|uniref:Terpene synthase n=1 Tax=Allocatelliglobosispora scoriae TaxID=643052 RepID=A0A841BJV7_9ACTN|nr:terpene synthase family protein [Allocatelliglobosispora scoriae]MBB5867449.1 hypothetical protein [Allocatelliglobosispora scoriae]
MELVGWARAWDLVTTAEQGRRLDAMRLAEFAADALPGGDTAERDLVAQWSAFICIVDDELDTTELGRRPERVRAAMSALIAVLDGHTAAPCLPAAEAALADLWARTAPRMTPQGRSAFVTHYQDFAAALVAEADLRSSSRRPTLIAYLPLRHRTIAIYPVIDIVECLALHSAPPDAPDLREALVDAIAIANDLASAGNDASHGHHNLLTVLAAERNCSAADAIAEASRMLSQSLQRFRTAAARSDPAHAAALSCLLTACVKWNDTTGRFLIDQRSSAAGQR